MRPDIKRTVVAVLALSAAYAGGWASFAPRSFYLSFPLPGHHWVASLPPYNEHLTRDVGGLYLALFVASAWCAVRGQEEMLAMTGLAWEAFSLPHLVFHLRHLAGMATSDAIGMSVALGGTVVLAGALLVPARTPAVAA